MKNVTLLNRRHGIRTQKSRLNYGIKYKMYSNAHQIKKREILTFDIFKGFLKPKN